jgi:hypothetical protein
MAGLTGAAGMISVANAVNVNPDGLGQVLLYPYYTARGGNDTLISVVNTTSAGKAVKIRFIEALNSREVLDFNIYLSAFDVWTGSVTDLEEDGLGDGPGIVTNDTTCTAPYIFGDQGGVQEFLDFQYNSPEVDTDGDGDIDFPGTIDGGPQGIERAASGYIEIIEMGTIEIDSSIEEDLTHVDGVPPDCDNLVDLWRTPAPGTTPSEGDLGWWNVGDPTFGFDTEAGATGGIFGAASIINVAEGTLFAYNATAVDAFWTPGQTNHTNPGDLLPSLISGDNNTSNVFVNGEVETINWLPGTPLALNATLTLAELMNEYTINPDLGGRTEWVLTFPTKRFHVDTAPGGSPLLSEGDDAIPPFSTPWTVSKPSSCDEQTFIFWDREEGVPEIDPGDPGDVIVSPPPPPTPGQPDPGFQLCREANVIRFANDGTLPAETEILKEPLRVDDAGEVDVLSYTNLNLPPEWISGWVRFNFTGYESAPGDSAGPNNTVIGLPVVGFSANTFTNGTLEGGVLSNYGGSFKHRGTRQSTFVSGD